MRAREAPERGRSSMSRAVEHFMGRYPSIDHVPPVQREKGVTPDHIRRAAEHLRSEGFALRDGQVMKAAQTIAEREKSPAHAALRTAKEKVEPRLPGASFAQYIRPLFSVGHRDTTILIDAPPELRRWIQGTVERRYFSLLLQVLEDSDFNRLEFV